MKISKNTLSILKNFSVINPGIQFKKGNVLRTISNQKNIYAKCVVEENFPTDFAIYDLSQFLSIISLDKNEIELEFDDKNIIVYSLNHRSKTYYRGCSSSMIIIPPEKDITMPSDDVQFSLSESDFKWILNSAAVLSNPHISVMSIDNSIRIVANNTQDNSAHIQELNLETETKHNFNFVFKTENISKILPGSYDVKISSKGIAHLTNLNINLEYFITTEVGSSFEL
jgi:hypothetical protein